MIVKIVVGCYGSFPHFLLSTSKTWNSLAEPKETMPHVSCNLDSCGFDMFLSNVINLLHLEKKE